MACSTLLLGVSVLFVWPAGPPSWIESAGNRLAPATWPVSARNLTHDAAGVLYQFLLLFLWGLLARRGLPIRGNTRSHTMLRFVLCAALAAALVFWNWRDSAALTWALVSGLIVTGWGFLLGTGLQRGMSGVVSWGSGSCLALAGAGAAALFGLTDPAPLVGQPPEVSTVDRQRLRALLQEARTRGEQPARVAIESADINLLAASWLAARETDVWAECELADGHVDLRATIPVEVPGLGRRFVNAVGAARPAIEEGRFDLELEQLRVGHVPLPRPLTGRIADAVAETVRADQQAQNALASIDRAGIVDGQLEVVGKPAPPPGTPAAPPPGPDQNAPSLAAAVRVHMQHLVAEASDLPEGDARFIGLLQTAFEFARSRSNEHAAAAENRAALVALGILVGDPRVRHFAGFPAQEPIPHFKYPYDRKVTLYGRNDLARHFLVSAALTALTGQELSDAVGLLKEQLDAAQGGSGFSFADLAADLAGARFAQRASRTDEAARLLQQHVSQPIGTGDVLPDLEGLPEGLSDAEFREEYGSVDDPRFRQMTAEIKRRLGTCPLLQPD